MKNIILAVVCAAMAIALTGCGTPRVVDAEAKGMYVNAATETLAIGSGSITTIPGDKEAAVGHYEEDTAWLSPSTKTHRFDVFIVGTNATQQASKIVEHICKAYGIVAPVLSSNETARATGMTVYDLFKAKKAASLEKIWSKLTPAAQAEIEKLVETGESGVITSTTTDGAKVEVKCENGDCEARADGKTVETSVETQNGDEAK